MQKFNIFKLYVLELQQIFNSFGRILLFRFDSFAFGIYSKKLASLFAGFLVQIDLYYDFYTELQYIKIIHVYYS